MRTLPSQAVGVVEVHSHKSTSPGYKYRLIVAVADRMQIAYIKFVGTHAEYDKVDAASVDQS